MNQITSTLTFHGTQFDVPQIVGTADLAPHCFLHEGLGSACLFRLDF